eukprot:CAMPEP_0180805296 /NCGR_PEP_ID=MMETSP1038_2-20121128/61937_1 /TAXON_ID=632150 /ORGANISM="Azadinium spinosum, Strain 3D9" /LENGTH=35 /DNA_ID= /DNA_START= /DNA_END= /DNA_ORIENTATION=
MTAIAQDALDPASLAVNGAEMWEAEHEAPQEGSCR